MPEESRFAPRSSARSRRGAALIEFGLVSLLLYVLLVGGIELGRLMFAAQALQDAARVAAREMSVLPLPADATFAEALAQVYDPNGLVLDIDDPDFETNLLNLPIVNQALRPLMIVDDVEVGGVRRRLLRYPGALLSGAGGLTVGIPRVVSRGAGGEETIEWVPVIEEIPCGVGLPFSLESPCPQAGGVAVVINYPFQSAGLSGFRANPAGPFEPNADSRIVAGDGSVTETNTAPGAPVNGEDTGPYAGPYGLGRQYAFAGQTLRPFRRLISAQAIFRREVIE